MDQSPKHRPKMKKLNLRNIIGQEEFDYQSLSSALRSYASPRDKITSLLRSGTIIRVRKGLYVFGENDRKRVFSKELLANLVLGPSYISLEYALQYYGLLPERVETITSVTVARSRVFPTPVGTFSYRQIPLRAFAAGMDRVSIDQQISFMIALPEKALIDKVQNDRGGVFKKPEDIRRYLEEDLRLTIMDLKDLRAERLVEYATAYGSQKTLLVANHLKELGK
jgi:predicted transcriptional regulator of viral defense system